MAELARLTKSGGPAAGRPSVRQARGRPRHLSHDRDTRNLLRARDRALAASSSKLVAARAATRDWRALRLALKRMLRALGLRCVAISYSRAMSARLHCGDCGKPIAPDEPVWRRYLRGGYCSCCEACAGLNGEWPCSILSSWPVRQLRSSRASQPDPRSHDLLLGCVPGAGAICDCTGQACGAARHANLRQLRRDIRAAPQRCKVLF